MAIIHSGAVEIRKISVGPFDNNAYVLTCLATREGVIIDTPAEPEKILEEAKGTKVKAVLMTHCHRDHVLGHEEIKRATGAPVWVHQSEASLLPLAPDRFFEDGGEIAFGAARLRALHVPGHTPGGACLLWDGHLFSGDTLFPNGPGRTASPEAFRQLVLSLEQRIFVLPDDLVVHPGHGADTVLGKEKEQYRKFQGRARRPDLCGDVIWLNA